MATSVPRYSPCKPEEYVSKQTSSQPWVSPAHSKDDSKATTANLDPLSSPWTSEVFKFDYVESVHICWLYAWK
jgi:hypothetical protein